MSARPLRIALAGYGWFGRIHHQAFREVPGATVVAVADPRDPRTSNVGISAQDAFHKDARPSENVADPLEGVRTFASLEALLAEMEVDLVDVVAPEEEHEALAAVALGHGIPTIVEKPFVTSAATARKLEALASRHSVPLYAGHVLRFDRRYRVVRERLSARGAVVRHLSLERHFQRAAHAVYGRTHPFYSALVHDIDLAIWLSGERVRRVSATTRSLLGKATPDVAVGILELDGGTLAVLQNTWHVATSCPFGFTFDTTIFADGETLRVRNEPDVHVWAEGEVAHPELHFWPLVDGARAGALVAELTHFAACAKLAAPSKLMPIRDAVHVIEVAEALILSSQRGTPVEVAQ